MMHKGNVVKALSNIEYLARDVNVNEINSHLALGNLSEWVNAWNGAMNEQIKNIMEAIKDERN